MAHPLRAIRKIVNAALTALSPEFEKLYARSGRPSIAPEKLTPSGEGPTVQIRFAPPASPFQNSPATSLGQQNGNKSQLQLSPLAGLALGAKRTTHIEMIRLRSGIRTTPLIAQ